MSLEWTKALAEDPVRIYAVGLISVVAGLLCVCVHIGERRFAKLNIPIEGRER